MELAATTTSTFPHYAFHLEFTAKAEAGQFLQHAEIHELKPRRVLDLWDMDKVIASLNWPDLRSLVESEPFNKQWKLQKSPAISQLLGTFLRQTGGDGILSKSVKYAGGFVISIYLTDDSQSKDLFTAQRIDIPEQVAQ